MAKRLGNSCLLLWLAAAVFCNPCSAFSATARSMRLTPAVVHHHQPTPLKVVSSSPLVARRRSAARTTTRLQVASAVILPSLPTIALSCLLPTCLGFYKVEYGVSYAYGSSVAILAYSIFSQLQGNRSSLAYWHALALLFYGARLILFLLYREVNIPRFRKFRERIESRQDGKSRLSRTPFVVGCACLYACLAAPLFVSSQAAVSCATPLYQAGVVTAWVGFVTGALGDLQKSFVKAMLGENTLVKGGIYRFLRHPNYTGEIVGWSGSFMASVAVALADWNKNFTAPLVAGFLGWLGIVSVLIMAATGLEKKQRETYGKEPGYSKWVKTSWAGLTRSKKETD